MTLQEIRLLHAYNAWATNKLFDALAACTAEETTRDMKSSHGSILDTMTHLVGAEKIWLARWVGTPRATMLKQSDVPTLADLRKVWETTGYETARWLGAMTDKTLLNTFTMTSAKGETFTYVYWQAIQHVVDHSTYHRGQVITLMRQIGKVPPSAGLITFYRESGRKQ
jgi:uncharacterized damage-inducible protein DinB